MRLLTMGLTLRAWQDTAHPREKDNRGALRLIRVFCPALALLALTALVQPVSAQEGADPPPPQGTADSSQAAACWLCDLRTRPTLTGDWGGYRSRLQERGLTFGATVTQFAFGMKGGFNAPVPAPFSHGDRGSYTGRGQYDLGVDLQKFGWLPHGKLLVTAEHWWGEYGNVSLSTGAFEPAVFGAALPPNANKEGTLALTNFFLVQPFSENLVVFVGKKVLVGEMDQDRFAGGNGTQQFMNQALVANPAFLLGMPYTGFAAGLVSPQKWGRMTVVVRDPENRTTDTLGLDNLFAKGVIVQSEVRLTTNFFGLPGDQHIGGVWKGFDQKDLNFLFSPPPEFPGIEGASSRTRSEGYTVFYGFDQFVVRYKDEEERGWGLFGRASYSDGNPTPLRYFVSAGLGGDSPFKGWTRCDKFGVGWYYTDASNEFGPIPKTVFGIQNGTGVELYYKFQVTPWIDVTPDLQYVRPWAHRVAEDAFLYGLRVNMKL